MWVQESVREEKFGPERSGQWSKVRQKPKGNQRSDSRTGRHEKGKEGGKGDLGEDGGCDDGKCSLYSLATADFPRRRFVHLRT